MGNLRRSGTPTPRKTGTAGHSSLPPCECQRFVEAVYPALVERAAGLIARESDFDVLQRTRVRGSGAPCGRPPRVLPGDFAATVRLVEHVKQLVVSGADFEGHVRGLREPLREALTLVARTIREMPRVGSTLIAAALLDELVDWRGLRRQADRARATRLLRKWRAWLREHPVSQLIGAAVSYREQAPPRPPFEEYVRTKWPALRVVDYDPKSGTRVVRCGDAEANGETASEAPAAARLALGTAAARDEIRKALRNPQSWDSPTAPGHQSGRRMLGQLLGELFSRRSRPFGGTSTALKRVGC